MNGALSLLFLRSKTDFGQVPKFRGDPPKILRIRACPNFPNKEKKWSGFFSTPFSKDTQTDCFVRTVGKWLMVFVVSEPDALSTLITRKKREKRWENRVCVRPKKRRRQHCFVVWWELMVLSVQFSRSTKSISIELSLCLTFQGQKKRPKPSFLFPPFPPSVFGQTK